MSAPTNPPGSPSPLRVFLTALALLVATVALYSPVAEHSFLNYDDNVYVVENPVVRSGLTGDGVLWAFGLHGHAANWHPLTWLSHMLDVELFGLDAGKHLIVNAVLHGLNAALLLVALYLMTGSLVPSLLAAALFAFHPLRVESVAWVAERKDVLAGFFWIATLCAYALYARRRSRSWYLLVLLTFALGLTAKPMLVTLPFALLLLDWWPLQRQVKWKHLALEKVPLLLLALACSIVTVIAQGRGGAFALEALTFPDRAANALVAYVAYLRTSVWPSGLAILYPHPAILDPDFRPWDASVLLAGILVAGLSVVAFRFRRRAPYLLVGWLWFLGTLVPVIGLVQVGVQQRADRYTYLPSIGLALGVVWLVWEAVRRHDVMRRVAAVAGLAVVLALADVTWRLVDHWKDSVTVFRHALDVTDRNYLAHTNLGEALLKENRLDEAARELEAALAIRPNLGPVHVNLGMVRIRQGRVDEGLRAFETAVRVQPGFAMGHANLGVLLQQRGADAAAVDHLRRALALDPNDPKAAHTLAWVLATSRDDSVRDGSEALRYATAACETTGYQRAEILEGLAAAHAELGDFDRAVRWQREALKRVPPSVRELLQGRLRLYEDRKPFRKNP